MAHAKTQTELLGLCKFWVILLGDPIREHWKLGTSVGGKIRKPISDGERASGISYLPSC